jgi:uncharacterized SAM-binding protein YcdF (DUF218 family)
MKRLILAAICAATAALLFVAWRVARQAGQDEARAADVILILGAAEYRGKPSPVLKARLDHAIQLYRRGLAPLLLTTGGHGLNSPFTEAEAARDYLVSQGISAENILLEAEGTSTLQSVAAAAEILERHNLKSCLVVTDGYHIFRAKQMLEARGLECWGSPWQGREKELPRRAWQYLKQSAGYWLWQLNLAR